MSGQYAYIQCPPSRDPDLLTGAVNRRSIDLTSGSTALSAAIWRGRRSENTLELFSRILSATNLTSCSILNTTNTAEVAGPPRDNFGRFVPSGSGDNRYPIVLSCRF